MTANSQKAVHVYRFLGASLGVLFLWAGLSKLLSTEEFVGVLASLEILPRSLLDLAASLILLTEFVLGLLLILGYRRRLIAIWAIVLLTIFTGVIGLVITRGITASCGCFAGVSGGQIGWGELARNVVLIALASLLAASAERLPPILPELKKGSR